KQALTKLKPPLQHSTLSSSCIKKRAPIYIHGIPLKLNSLVELRKIKHTRLIRSISGKTEYKHLIFLQRYRKSITSILPWSGFEALSRLYPNASTVYMDVFDTNHWKNLLSKRRIAKLRLGFFSEAYRQSYPSFVPKSWISNPLTRQKIIEKFSILR